MTTAGKTIEYKISHSDSRTEAYATITVNKNTKTADVWVRIYIGSVSVWNFYNGYDFSPKFGERAKFYATSLFKAGFDYVEGGLEEEDTETDEFYDEMIYYEPVVAVMSKREYERLKKRKDVKNVKILSRRKKGNSELLLVYYVLKYVDYEPRHPPKSWGYSIEGKGSNIDVRKLGLVLVRAGFPKNKVESLLKEIKSTLRKKTIMRIVEKYGDTCLEIFNYDEKSKKAGEIVVCVSRVYADIATGKPYAVVSFGYKPYNKKLNLAKVLLTTGIVTRKAINTLKKFKKLPPEAFVMPVDILLKLAVRLADKPDKKVIEEFKAKITREYLG